MWVLSCVSCFSNQHRPFNKSRDKQYTASCFYYIFLFIIFLRLSKISVHPYRKMSFIVPVPKNLFSIVYVIMMRTSLKPTISSILFVRNISHTQIHILYKCFRTIKMLTHFIIVNLKSPIGPTGKIM